MGYNEVANAVKSTLLLHSDFNDDNVSVSDYRIFGGGQELIVVIIPAGAPQRQVVAHQRKISTNWNLALEVYTPWRGEIDDHFVQAAQNFEKLLNHLDLYPTLGKSPNIISALCSNVGAPQLGRDNALGQFSVVVVTCVVTETKIVQIAE